MNWRWLQFRSTARKRNFIKVNYIYISLNRVYKWLTGRCGTKDGGAPFKIRIGNHEAVIKLNFIHRWRYSVISLEYQSIVLWVRSAYRTASGTTELMLLPRMILSDLPPNKTYCLFQRRRVNLVSAGFGKVTTKQLCR